MKTTIHRRRLYAVVTIEAPTGEILTTTMRRDIQASDHPVRRLKCRLAHVPFTPMEKHHG